MAGAIRDRSDQIGLELTTEHSVQLALAAESAMGERPTDTLVQRISLAVERWDMTPGGRADMIIGIVKQHLQDGGSLDDVGRAEESDD